MCGFLSKGTSSGFLLSGELSAMERKLSELITASNSLKCLIVLSLWTLFTYEAYLAIDKYLKGTISLIHEKESRTLLANPSVTFCPKVKSVEFEHASQIYDHDIVTFARDPSLSTTINLVDPDSISALNAELNDSLTYERLWTKTYSMLHSDEVVVRCQTYTPVRPARVGRPLMFHINTRNTEYVNVLLHNTRQVFAGWNRIYGTGVIYLKHNNPKAPASYYYEMGLNYINKLDHPELPCQTDYIPKLMDCIDDYVEQKYLNCSLPWRTGTKTFKNCKKTDEFSKYRENVLSLSRKGELGLYRNTRCYYHCNYFNFEPMFLYQDTFEDDEAKILVGNATVEISLVYAKSEVNIAKDVKFYDGYETVGDIGGFLGLLLGASVLSMYEFITDYISKYRTHRRKVSTSSAPKKSSTAFIVTPSPRSKGAK